MNSLNLVSLNITRFNHCAFKDRSQSTKCLIQKAEHALYFSNLENQILLKRWSNEDFILSKSKFGPRIYSIFKLLKKLPDLFLQNRYSSEVRNK